MWRLRAGTAAGVPIILGLLLAAGWQAQALARDWTTYRNARHGYMIAYPTGTFQDTPQKESEDGRLMVSQDGRARLLVGAFANNEEVTLESYRELLLAESYPGATLDYAPVKARWFVLSGTRDGTMFYERVSFTCGGRLLTSWALLYPVAERRTWDRVVEGIARTYAPGAGRSGDCD